MPGWYIHMEAAKQAVDRLRAGDVPPDFPGGAAAAQELGEIAYKWRNYLAAGAIGPDIFFLLPDFKGELGNTLLHFVEWIRDVWEWIDKNFMESWEKWADPAITGAGQILNQLSGQVLGEIGQALQELAAAIKDAVLDLIAQLWDWFGLLTSGVPQAFEDTAFFWSDMFHYRKTYKFPQTLFESAKNDQQKAFALGWMSHCATDVTGHPFVNAKCGGPYRLHWQRHHLIENHMDAVVYDGQHGGIEPYGELDTSALHFRLAFRKRHDAGYNGASDAPAYDYFSGLPSYDPNPAGDFKRAKLWDLDTGDLPDELCQLIIDAMQAVFGDTRAPAILKDDAAEFRDGNSGRPSIKAIQNTFWTLYHYVKFTTTGGYSPRHPEPPSVIGDHSPPPFPGSDGGVSDDQTRGEDPDEDDSWSLLDIFLALFAWLAYIIELAIWLTTLPIAVVNDILTYPAREVLYEYVVAPLWQLYLAARQPLVKLGFLVPKHEEIIRGLAELGVSSTGGLQDLAAALASPTGTATAPIAFDDPSGRSGTSGARGADPAFPRAIIEDTPTLIAQIIGFFKSDLFCGNSLQPSEFLSPWRYPATNNAGAPNGWEPALSHPGPYKQGQDARVLMNNAPGNKSARTDFEQAADPAATETVCENHLGGDRHLGDAVDYGVYLIGRLAQNQSVPDFNLDADRGYGYRCWDWDRKNERLWNPPTVEGSQYDFHEPCTPPEGFCPDPNAANGPAPKYNAFVNVAVHYDDAGPSGCQPPKYVSQKDIADAGYQLPSGQKG